jgi:hypothetical protein
MPKLLVRATLPNLDEAKPLKEPHYLAGLEGGKVAHYATLMV